VEHLPEQMTPLGQKKLTKKEQVERYLEMRDDPEKWIDLLTEHGLVETIDYAKKMEALYVANSAGTSIDSTGNG
jgi:metal-sulfur cluster biosynthetic enzyme